MKGSKKPLAKLLGAAFVTSVAGSLAAPLSAEGNPFVANQLPSGYNLAAHHDEGKDKKEEKRRGEGSCGEGKCGGDKSKSEGSCGEGKCGGDKSKTEGSCGEGKCGGDKSKTEGSCGEGKCGGHGG